MTMPIKPFNRHVGLGVKSWYSLFAKQDGVLYNRAEVFMAGGIKAAIRYFRDTHSNLWKSGHGQPVVRPGREEASVIA